MNNQISKILVIEDDPNSVFVIREILKSEIPTVEVTDSGTLRRGMEEIASGKAWDAVLLDLGLPDCSGLDTFLRVRTLTKTIPVLVLTGHDDESLAIKAVQEGAQDYLVKGTVDGALLVRAIRYAIERDRVQRELRKAHDWLEEKIKERTGELAETNDRLQREVHDKQLAEKALRESNRLLQDAMRDLKESQRQVIQRERLHALGNMASGIAHDFNNALAPIVGFTDLLLLRPDMLQENDKVIHYLEMMRDSAKDAARVVRSLREFSRDRGESDVRAAFSLNEVVTKAVELTKPRWRDQALASGVSIQIDTDLDELPPFMGGESEFREVLTSLIFNAVEATRKEGTITIRTRLHNGRIILEVADQGSGMSEETRRRCMDPFFSTKGDGASGFGLPTVFGVVERHEGTIEIDSALGKGTTVRIKLPVASGLAAKTPVAKPAPAAQEAPRRPARKVGPMRILVADDEPLLREVVVACLADEGHTTQTAANGNEALEIFRGGTFDLVITDRAMPGMSGDQLAGEIKRINPGMRVILLTGFGDLMKATGEMPEGVDLIVSKPFTVETLSEAIGAVCN